jgi:hypothetical protein
MVAGSRCERYWRDATVDPFDAKEQRIAKAAKMPRCGIAGMFLIVVCTLRCRRDKIYNEGQNSV